MSHITKVKTQLKDNLVLKSVLKNLGYVIEEGGFLIHGRESVKVEFTASRKDLSIGFNRTDQDNDYEVFADWHRATKQKLLGEIFQGYSREKIIKMARLRGYSVIQNRVDQNGRIEMVLRKVA
jgi:hypothetical protein